MSRRRSYIAWPALAMPLFLGSCEKSPVAPVKPDGARRDTLPRFAQVDYPLSWSTDGNLAAFRRCVPSSYGGPGLYVIPRFGGKPLYVLPANIFWPKEVRFSPDGTRVAGVWNFSLFIADLRTGRVDWPYYTANGVGGVDWSPDGNTLLLSRRFYLPEQPEDSAGVHLFDVRTGRDEVFLSRGRHVYGGDPRWSPDGDSFAVVEYTDGAARVAIYGLRDSSLKIVWPGTRADDFENLQWVRPALFGHLKLAVRKYVGERQGSYLMDPDGSRLERLPYSIFFSALSPTRPELLTLGWSGADSLGVVGVDWVSEDRVLWGRRLTAWRPPQ
ncbi:MAG: WD40 repeat domain-containing protein [Candidatus Eisenbacteria bacterium]|nr:WD40 repeat domain-containing protein [Candidatus Eisenbacteria bacterium]